MNTTKKKMKFEKMKLIIIILMILSCGNEKKPSDFDKFTGRWKLHIVETQTDSFSDWKPRQDHYKNRQGFIIYDGKGGMGVHHVTENYEIYELESPGGIDSLTINDLRHLANNFVYFGKYRVNDSSEIIEHHIESSISQSRWGTVAKRNYLFTGDTLTLSPITNRYPKTRLKWIRLNDIE